MEELQFEVDGLQSKLFDLSKEKEKVKKIDEELKKLDDELEKYRFFRNLPDNIEQRIDVFDSLQENKGRDLDDAGRQIGGRWTIKSASWKPARSFTPPIFSKAGAGAAGAGILGMILDAMNL